MKENEMEAMLMDEPSTQLTVAERAPLATTDPPTQPPSVESMLMLAIDKGMNAETMERLVALQERVMAQRAAQAFNGAMLAFRSECPAVMKTGEASDRTGKTMYRFAKLEEITKVVDPILFKHGLTYSWNTDLAGDLTVVVCTVQHIGGHEKSSKFTCKGSGTQIMNAAQIAASAVTFGKRYSLISVLGITVDDDNDGRRAAPMPQPDHDRAAPNVKPRDLREQDDGTPKVTAAKLNELFGGWQKRIKPDGSLADFVSWAKVELHTEADMSKPGNWTVDCVNVIEEALHQ